MDALGSLTSILKPVSSLLSAGSGLYNSYENQQYQNMLRGYAENPSKFNAYAGQFVQPLNAGLIAGVNNQAQGYAAERGLAQSPALDTSIEEQAIAPYIQQNTNQGYQAALQALGLGGGPSQAQNPTSQLASAFSGLNSLSPYAAIANASNPSGLTTTSFDPSSTIPNVPTSNFPDWYTSSFATS